MGGRGERKQQTWKEGYRHRGGQGQGAHGTLFLLPELESQERLSRRQGASACSGRRTSKVRAGKSLHAKYHFQDTRKDSILFSN